VDGRDLLLEDTDPHRDCYDLPVEPRLSAAAAGEWQRRLDAAMRCIAAGHPGYLPGIRAALTTVVPLRPDGAGGMRSAAARAAFGAVAVAPAADDAALAELLVHEVQHLKLGAVLDVQELFDRADRRALRVPWRPDPRPVEGALQGTYAFLAVADLWRTRPGGAAVERFERYRRWTDGAAEALLRSGALTPAWGVPFVERMRATLAAW
jgi:uncharacterized protein